MGVFAKPCHGSMHFHRSLNIKLNHLGASKSEIRRLIKGNGIKINNQVINDEKFTITEKLFIENFIKLSIGKKRHIKVKLN